VDALRLVAFGVVLFGATNSDDLLLLISWFADRRVRAGQVVAGQYVGQGVILAASGIAAAAVLAIAAPWVRLFGLVPLTIGIGRLGRLLVGGPEADPEPSSTVGGIAEVAALTISSGGDNVGAYAPVFATRPTGEGIALVGIALVMTALWCLAGFVVARHPRTRAAAHRWGRLLLPLVMIAVGVSILAVG
jgi:cadmium resistance protein CadD (predicted permease)